jgi:hypothetical protein
MMSYHLLLTRTFYEEERSDRLSPQQKERQRQRALRDGVGRAVGVGIR